MTTQQMPTHTAGNVSRKPLAAAGHDLLSAARRWAGKLREYNAAKRPQRYAVVKMAGLEAVDDGAAGMQREVALRDISESGVGFLTDVELSAGEYQITLPALGQGLTSTARSRRIKVLRVQSLGLYFDVSAKFVQRTQLALPELANASLNQIDAGVSRLRQHQLAMHQLVRSIDRRLQTANSIPKEPN